VLFCSRSSDSQNAIDCRQGLRQKPHSFSAVQQKSASLTMLCGFGVGALQERSFLVRPVVLSLRHQLMEKTVFKSIARTALILALATSASVASAESSGTKIVKSTPAAPIASSAGITAGTAVTLVVGGLLFIGVVVQATDNTSGSHGS
jgi:hypothetical protein